VPSAAAEESQSAPSDHRAHAEPHHEHPVDGPRGRGKERDEREPHREAVAPSIGRVEDLLDRAQHAEKRREDQSLGQDRQLHLAMGQRLGHVGDEAGGPKRAARLGGQRLGLAEREPADGDHREDQEGHEDRAPAEARDDRRADQGGDGGEEREDQHRVGHDLRHGAARVEVPDHGQRHHARPRRAEALDHAGQKDHLQRGRDEREPRAEEVERGPHQDHGLAPQRVRNRAHDQRADPHAEHEARQDQLRAVGVLGRQFRRDLRQRGQHRVDGEGHRGEDRAHERDEFGPREALLRGHSVLARNAHRSASAAASCALMSSITCIQSSGGCAPLTTCWRATTKQGTPATPRDRAEASRARRSSGPRRPPEAWRSSPRRAPRLSAISRKVAGSPISRPSTK
jgi:hypothetical protein